ncbi:extracellular serine/threonine protein CG31145-like [Babylonia areolata]|uniref:extracellular serine/threonine protein CG31145-like n=1 Tax=Babylonia areolata TaxID=304850 RepID=UPI003FD1897F
MRQSAIRRNIALLLLFGIFLMNFYIFLTLPSNRSSDGLHPRDVDWDPQQPLQQQLHYAPGISHLQFPRKRLNKSNYTSDSIGADGAGGAGAGARDPRVWGEEDRGSRDHHPHKDLPRDRMKLWDAKKSKDTEGAWEKPRGEEDHPPPPPPPPFPPDQSRGRVMEDGTWEEGGGGEDNPPNQGEVRRFNARNEHRQSQEVEERLDMARKEEQNPAADEEEGNDPSHNRHPPPAAVDGQGRDEADHDLKFRKALRTTPETVQRTFADPKVDAFMRKLEKAGLLDVVPEQGGLQENYWTFLRRQRLRRKPGIQLPAYRNYRARTNWEQFHRGIHQHYLYDPDSPYIRNLLKDLADRKIVQVEQKDGGTQIKLIMTFDNGGQALFKPMRFPRETETLPDHFYFADYERHVAEIGAFHLDRVLGYNRVPPVAGRLVNLTRDIRDLADSKLAKTFFVSPAGNLCFHGYCSYYCDSSHPVCGHPDQVEGSLMAFLPPDSRADRATWRNPWKRSYSKRKKAYWETHDDLCDRIRRRSPYNTGRRLMDIVDMSVLDFLMGNLDRHHYETFESFNNNSIPLHLDNGRGFGKQHEDDVSCLAPMVQCCMLRLSTLQRLARLYWGPSPLSLVMKMSLSTDQVSPVLIEGHLQALDRRLVQVLRAVNTCVQEGRPLEQVIIDDGVY